MAADLAGIEKLIEQHNEVRRNLRLVGDQVADMEAFFDLQRTYAAWSQSSLEELAQKRVRSEQTINQLDEGLRNHFEAERESFIPLLGETLAAGLELEHNEIIARISALRLAVTNPGFAQMAAPQLATEKVRIERMVREVLETIEQHAGTEDGIMKMLRKTLLQKGS